MFKAPKMILQTGNNILDPLADSQTLSLNFTPCPSCLP